MKHSDFLQQLTAEAKFQSRLEERRWLPRQFDAVFAFIGTYSWQTLFIASFLGAVAIEVWR